MTAVALAVLVGAGALAACGDDGDGGNDDIVLEDIGGSSTDDDSDESAEDDDEADTDTTEGIGIAGEGCEEFTEAFTALGESIGAGFGDVEGDAISDFNAAVEDAPEEIRDELQLFSEAFQAYADALEEAGVDFDDPSNIDPDAAAELAELTEIFTDEEFVEASAAIQEFVASGCEG